MRLRVMAEIIALMVDATAASDAAIAATRLAESNASACIYYRGREWIISWPHPTPEQTLRIPKLFMSEPHFGHVSGGRRGGGATRALSPRSSARFARRSEASAIERRI
jgi:hypothetical protein